MDTPQAVADDETGDSGIPGRIYARSRENRAWVLQSEGVARLQRRSISLLIGTVTGSAVAPALLRTWPEDVGPRIPSVSRLLGDLR